MNVFCDFHHAGLLNSFIMLFENRLGGNVYRPIGTEWAEEGYWKVYDHPATIQQYLTTAQGYKPVDGSQPLNNITKVENGIYYCQDIDSGYYNKAIDFDNFRKLDIDVVIASLPQHIEPFRRLIAEHKPNAKLIYQVGNQWDGIYAENIMASARLKWDLIPEFARREGTELNFIEYHQEFDLNIFKPILKEKPAYITSLLNVPEQYPSYNTLLEVEKLVDGQVKIYGGQSRDGARHGTIQVAQAIQDSKFVWQVKPGGDGYGHILFNSYACGVPVITAINDYAGKLGEDLLLDGRTCIAIDNLSPSEIAEKVKHYAQPDEYFDLSYRAYKQFCKVVDFDYEADRIKEFLMNLR
jgi:hypothetical protein